MALMACAMMALPPSWAGGKQTALVVWNGETELYSFYVSDNPVLKVNNGYAIILSDGEWQEEVNLETVKNKCYYSIPMSESSHYKVTMEQRDYIGTFGHEEPTGVQQPRATIMHPAFSVKDGILQVAGLSEGERVTISTPDGKVTAQTRADRSGQASASLHALKGTAIIKAGNVSFKVMVR